MLLTCQIDRLELPARVLDVVAGFGLVIERCVMDGDAETGVIDVDLETYIYDGDGNITGLIKAIGQVPGVELEGVMVDERLVVIRPSCADLDETPEPPEGDPHGERQPRKGRAIRSHGRADKRTPPR